MRLGKSATAIWLQQARNCNCLIVCPAYLIPNWKKEINKWNPKAIVTMFRSGKEIYDVCDSDFVVTSYDLLQKAEFLFQWADMVVGDECFHGDTLIETPDGERKISEIKEGDIVLNFGGAGAVSRISKKKIDNVVSLKYGGRTVLCSEGHLFFTQRGWTPARLLKQGDIIYGSHKKMSSVRETFYEKYSTVPLSFVHPLLQILLEEEDREEKLQKLWKGIHSNLLSKSEKQMGNVLPKMCGTGNGDTLAEQSLAAYAASKKAHSENSKVQGNKEHDKDSRREREDSSNREESDANYDLPRIPLQLYCDWRSVLSGNTLTLQDRLWESTEENMCGAGRIEPLWIEKKGSRQPKRRSFEAIRVDSVEIQKCGSGKGQEDGYFYDIEVLGHPSYFVNGALVHNCHHLKNMATKRTQFFHRALYENGNKYFHGLTGTPIKNRVKEFYSLLSLANYDPKQTDHSFLDNYPDEITFAEQFSFPETYEVQVRKRTVLVTNYHGIRNKSELRSWLKGKYIRIKAGKNDLPPISYLDTLVSDIDDKTLLDSFNKYFISDREAYARAKGKPGQKNQYDVRRRRSSSVLPEHKRNAAVQKVPFTIKYTEDLLESAKCVLIYSDHREPCKLLAEHFKVPAITGEMPATRRAQLVNDFQSGKLNIICATVGALKEGSDLYRAKDMVMNDPPWVPGDIQQVINRMRALGHKEPRTVHRILGSPQDEKIWEVLEDKMRTINIATRGTK